MQAVAPVSAIAGKALINGDFTSGLAWQLAGALLRDAVIAKAGHVFIAVEKLINKSGEALLSNHD